MMRSRKGAGIALGLTIAASLGAGRLLFAQVTVSHDESVEEVKSPMKIEIGLGASPGANGAMRPPMIEGGPKIQRIFSEVSRYRVDKAKAKWVAVRRDYEGDKVIVRVGVPLSTEWTRQDLDLRISLHSAGKEVAAKAFEDLTIGSEDSAAAKLGMAFSSTSKTPEAEFKLERSAWDAMFVDGAAPVVRVVIAIEE